MRLEGKPSKLTNEVIGRRLEGQKGSVHINLCNSCDLQTNPRRTCKYKPLPTDIYIYIYILNVYLLFSYLYIASVNTEVMSSLKEICAGLPLDPLPPNRGRDPSIPHAPVRTPNLTPAEERVGQYIAKTSILRYL